MSLDLQGMIYLIQKPHNFTYATVAVNHQEAEEFINKVIKDYRIQNGELKFQKLVRHSKGKQAISYLLSNFSDYIKVCVAHKKI